MTADEYSLTGAPPDAAVSDARRRLAESRLRESTTTPEARDASASPGDSALLVHELRVHQIELELQNEELRQAHLELDAARARWFDLYDMAPVGYCTVSARGLIVQANLTLTVMLDVPRSALAHAPFGRLVAMEDRGRWYALHEQLFTGGAPHTCELRMLSANVKPWDAQLTITAASDDHGAPELRIALTDIGARKRAEREALASRSLLDSIIDSTPSSIFSIDRLHRFTLVNAAMQREHGLTKEQMLGKTVEDLFAPDVATAQHIVNERIMRTGVMESLEEVLVGRNGGEPRIVVSTKFPLRDEHGAVCGLSGVATDVTEHRISEAERTSLAAQLRQGQKMESIGRLAGGVAHDFNNQLEVILGNAELALARFQLTSPEHSELTEIRDAAMRSAELTRQLLTFARRQSIQPTVLDLNKTVSHVLTMLRRLIGENIDLVWQPADSLPPVMMDAAQVEQILANLAVNARDAIAGHGTITVVTANVVLDEAWCAARGGDATPGEYVRASVSDTGRGMSADILAKVFEPFFTTKGVGEGTGLGLASVYGAIRQNGGFITVTSDVGRGTTFDIYLPRAPEGSEPTTRPSVATEPPARGHETILLVEDEPAVRRLTARLLEAQGYTVLAADSPAAAEQLAREHTGRIALVLTDVVMPGMEGPALADLLVAAHPELRCLFMSGYSVHAAEFGVPLRYTGHFIAKPFTLSALTMKVREVLDGA